MKKQYQAMYHSLRDAKRVWFMFSRTEDKTLDERINERFSDIVNYAYDQGDYLAVIAMHKAKESFENSDNRRS